MFAFLRGVVAATGPGRVHLDVNGAGYEVFVPESTARRLRAGSEVILQTHCHIREDAFQIFGFLRDEEKSLFELLLGISGVGPKVAVTILSALSPADFGRAVLEADVTAFTKVPGVGKKTAQRLVLELKNKMGQDAELAAILGEDAISAVEDGDDVHEALLSLGCTPAEAKNAADKARKELGEKAADEDLVKAALQSMARV